MTEHKGTIKVDLNSRPRKTDRVTILLKCGHNGKEYTLKQPDGEVNLAEEKSNGHTSSIDDWAEGLTSVVDKLRKFNEQK